MSARAWHIGPLSLALIVGCGSLDPDCPGSDPRCANVSDLIVDVDWLESRLDDGALVIVDTRQTPTEHIPGAISLLPTALAGTLDGVDGQVLPADEAEPVLQAAGLTTGTTVVYGTAPEYDPARVVWALHYYRHQDVHYLDGGWEAWVAAGGETQMGTPQGEPSDYTVAGTDDSIRVTGDWVKGELGPEPFDEVGIQIVDARSPDEYAAGRIPTATNLDWVDNLDDGLLRSRADLDARYAELDPNETTVAYCVLGWRASFAWLTMRSLGFNDVRVYDGSWDEWGSGDFPVETD